MLNNNNMIILPHAEYNEYMAVSKPELGEINLRRSINASLLKCDELRDEISLIRDSLNFHNRNVNISRIFGGGLGLGGAATVAAGLITLPMTFGGSGILIAVGMGVGIAGSGVTVGSDLTRLGITSNKMKKVERLMNELQISVEKVHTDTKVVVEALLAAGKCAGLGANLANMTVRCMAEFGDDIAKGVVARLPLSLGRASAELGVTTLAVAGLVFGVALDLYTIISSSLDLNSKRKGECDEKLGKCLKGIDEVTKELQEFQQLRKASILSVLL